MISSRYSISKGTCTVADLEAATPWPTVARHSKQVSEHAAIAMVIRMVGLFTECIPEAARSPSEAKRRRYRTVEAV
jgi:hypothetical protein